ncbi:MAG TPA: phytoene/squalene synthase family protein [Candidatus Limnocylindrales bacterium]|nr:phytoene/squalene synthase family protein [Candidatus Limnocylindrales bacterium]
MTHHQLSHAYAVCRGIARREAKNFYYGFLVLPAEKRNAFCAVYAFMRHADDISDDPALDHAQKRQKLGEWMEAARQVFAGRPTDDPVLMAVGDAQQKFKIPAELFEKLVYGTSIDLEIPPPTGGLPSALCNTFEDLKQYCYHVASIVGLVCIRIFGYEDSKAEFLAEDCGLAFQLTNIVRDVKEDAGLGRIYFPREDLERFSLNEENFSPLKLADAAQAQALRPVLEYEADRARKYYESAKWLMELIHEDSRAALWVLVEIYSRLLKRISDRNYDVFTERVRLSTWEKMSVLARGFWLRIA